MNHRAQPKQDGHGGHLESQRWCLYLSGYLSQDSVGFIHCLPDQKEGSSWEEIECALDFPVDKVSVAYRPTET